jgi:hypothetical protein
MVSTNTGTSPIWIAAAGSGKRIRRNERARLCIADDWSMVFGDEVHR